MKLCDNLVTVSLATASFCLALSLCCQDMQSEKQVILVA